jgi:DNA helicase HerA-like ATPase
MANAPALYLGSTRALDGAGAAADLRLPAHHLVTHGVVVGMTGPGKTGLTTVMIEEATNAGVPVLVIDVKGDLPNLLLAFPDFDSERLMPWVEGCAVPEGQRRGRGW